MIEIEIDRVYKLRNASQTDVEKIYITPSATISIQLHIKLLAHIRDTNSRKRFQNILHERDYILKCIWRAIFIESCVRDIGVKIINL